MVTLYGLRTCDTCRKALKALASGGVSAAFVDVRAEADLATLAPIWLQAVGVDALVNRKSTTWRALSDDERAAASTGAEAAALLSAHPTLVKRPVIVTADGAVYVGWTHDVQAALGLAGG